MKQELIEKAEKLKKQGYNASIISAALIGASNVSSVTPAKVELAVHVSSETLRVTESVPRAVEVDNRSYNETRIEI